MTIVSIAPPQETNIATTFDGFDIDDNCWPNVSRDTTSPFLNFNIVGSDEEKTEKAQGETF